MLTCHKLQTFYAPHVRERERERERERDSINIVIPVPNPVAFTGFQFPAYCCKG